MFKNDAVNLNEAYDYVEFTLATASTNYDVKTNQSGLWNKIPVARIIVIETSANISVRFNDTGFPAVKLDAGASPMELVNKLNIKNIFITNASGVTATIRIWLFI